MIDLEPACASPFDEYAKHRDRCRKALEGSPLQSLAMELGADDSRRLFPDQNVARPRFPLQPRGQVGRFAHQRILFGCDIAGGLTAAAVPAAAADQLAANDEETAAVARETQARGVPFIAFRAVSDNEDFGVFFQCYQPAADNVRPSVSSRRSHCMPSSL